VPVRGAIQPDTDPAVTPDVERHEKRSGATFTGIDCTPGGALHHTACAFRWIVIANSGRS
jgi:hypothetical protein